MPRRPKDYDLAQPNIDVAVSDDGQTITLTTDKPALYVTYDHGGAAV